MHIRSTFRNYLFLVITMGGRRRLVGPTIGRVGAGLEGDSPGKSGESHSLRGHVEGRTIRKADDAMLPRKASKERNGSPSRIPTQVGEEKILRRECDPSFRNSANSRRTFGI